MRFPATLLGLLFLATSALQPLSAAQRRIALTVDDLPAQRAPDISAERVLEINRRMVEALEAAGAPAVGFVNESKLEINGQMVPERVEPLELWLDAGLELGNHTWSHPDVDKVPLDRFLQEILDGERVTRPLVTKHGVPLRYFRHPYLHAGDDMETKTAVEEFLAEHGYIVAPVTIDNSEWIFARAYDNALDAGDEALTQRVAAAYLEHMDAMVEFYEGQSRKLLDREIPQVLLIHANDLNAHHLDDLLDMLRDGGYTFIDLEHAMSDPAYQLPDRYTGPWGIGWIQRWAMTRGVDKSFFHGEPTVPDWVDETAGLGN